jgi:predicted ATPase
LDLLTYLVRRLRGDHLFVLATWRGEDLPPEHRLRRLLAEAERDGGGSSIRLSRLGSQSVRELVEPLALELGASPERLSQRLYDETEGLPFFLAEYLAALPEAAGETEDWSMPRGVRAILLSRLEAARETGRQLLQTAAVIGRSFDFDTLQESSGRSAEETATTLEELQRRGLIRESRPAQTEVAGEIIYDFSHDKMRAMVYAETSQARRRILHLRVAESLIRHRHAPKEQLRYAGQIAYHYRQGGRSQEAAEFSGLAGEYARSLYANTEALAHFQIALAMGHPDFVRLEEAIGDLYTLQGDYKAALSSFTSAAEYKGAHSQDIARLRHKMGNVYDRVGEWKQAEACFQAAAPGMEGADLSRLYADWSRTLRRSGEGEQARQMAAQALELAEKAGDAPALAQAHNTLGMLLRLPVEGQAGDLEGAIRHLEESLALAEKLPDPGARVAALNNLSLAYADHHELERALEYARQALELCTRQGDRHRQAALHSNLADLYHAAGLEEPSMAQLKQAVVIFSEIGASEADRPRPEIWKLTEW